jgi:hypothetical protein
MSRLVIAGGILILAAGCSTQDVGQVGQVPRQEITYAATAKYPGNPQASGPLHAVVLDSPGAKELDIYNLSNNAMPQSAIWVNGAFVHLIPSIPPKGHVTISYNRFLQSGPGTADLSQVDQAVTEVDAQTSGGLYKLEGPTQK